MQNSRSIKVFLGSSIVELKNERQNLNSLSNDIINLLRQDNIFATFIKSEDMGLRLESFMEHDQHRIDRELIKCNLSLFLFKSRAGKWTRHEYNVARDLKNREKSHTITICFLHVSEDEKEDSLRDFQQQLIDQGDSWEDCRDLTEVQRIISLSVLSYLGIALPTTPEADIAEKLGDELFSKFKYPRIVKDEQKQHLCNVIDEILVQIPVIMASCTNSVVAKIVKAGELYYKADLWASNADYDKEKHCGLLFDYAVFLYEYGLYNDAEAVYLRQIPLAEELYGFEHEKTAHSYKGIGEVYWRQGNYLKSIKYHQMALEIRKRVCGINNIDTATSYNEIGLISKAQGDYKNAMECFEKALAVFEEVLGKDHPYIAVSFNNIGEVYFAQGDYGNALEYFEKALKIKERFAALDRPSIATTYNNIGTVYQLQGNFREASEYYKKALAIDETFLGKDHPSTIRDYNNIGSVYHLLGEYQEALGYLEMASKKWEEVLGNEHTYTAFSYGNIGKVYHSQGDYRNALKYYKRAMAIHEKTLGRDHPSTARDYNYIGSLYYQWGKYQEALVYLEKALIVRKAIWGNNHPYTMDTQKLIDATKSAIKC